MYSKKVETPPNCLICVEPIKFYGLGSCEHKYICHLCIYKIRVLQKNIQCPVCKTNQTNIIITDNLEIKYKTYNPSNNAQEYLYTDKEAEQVMKDLGSIMCPVRSCQSDERFPSHVGLKKHLLQFHQLHYCEICLASKMCSLSEQILYTKHELDRHINHGDINESNQVVFFHPFCKYCTRNFFDDDQMQHHLNHNHERCNICKNEIYTYYQSYLQLENHYRKSHFMCQDQSCQDKKFIAFESQKELDLHKLTVHDKQTKITNQLLIQLTGFYNQEEKKPQITHLRLKDNEGYDFSYQLLSVFKNKNKGFKASSHNEGDSINIIDVYGVQFDQWKQSQPHKYQNQQEFFIEDLTLIKNIPYQTFADFYYRAGLEVNKEQVQKLNNAFSNYRQYQGNDQKFFEEFLQICGLKTGLELFQFLLATIQDKSTHSALKSLYMEKIMKVKSKSETLLNECKTYKQLLKLILDNIEIGVLSRLKQKTILPDQFYLDQDRVKQQQQILKSFSNQDKNNMKLAANFAVEHKSISLMKQIIIVPKQDIQGSFLFYLKDLLKQLDNYQLLMVFVFFLIANGYIYFNLIGNMKYNLFESLIEKKKNITKNENQMAQIQKDKEDKQIKAQQLKVSQQFEKEQIEIQLQKKKEQEKFDLLQTQIQADKKKAQLKYQKEQKEKKEQQVAEEKKILKAQQEQRLKAQQEQKIIDDENRLQEQLKLQELQNKQKEQLIKQKEESRLQELITYQDQIEFAIKQSKDEYQQQLQSQKIDKKKKANKLNYEKQEESKNQEFQEEAKSQYEQNDQIQQSKSQITPQDYGCWEEDPQLITKNALNRQEIGRVKKKGKNQKVFLSGGFK